MALEQVSIFDLITPQFLENTVLGGVNLTLDDGSPYPDEIFEQAIRFAVSMVERELDIVIDPFETDLECEEGQDAIFDMENAWWAMELDRRPIVEITSLARRYANYAPLDLPASWVRLTDRRHGHINIMPSSDPVTGVVFGGLPYYPLNMLSPAGYVPGFIRVGYKAGFLFLQGTLEIPEGETEVEYTLPWSLEDPYDVKYDFVEGEANGAAGLRMKRRGSKGFTLSVSTAPAGGSAQIAVTVNTAGADITQAIILSAAMLPLAVAGDLIAGAGIASISTSMDGLSQTLNTTSSATNSGYGARVLQYERQLKALMGPLMGKWRSNYMFSF